MTGRITQISLFGALLCGKYDGVATVRRIRECGDMAIGTMDMLDGEMLMIDGTVYQVRADGEVRLPADDETIPFATIADFRTSGTSTLSNISSFEALEQAVEAICPNRNVPVAIRISGSFPLMKTRSVGRQPNGVRLAEAAENETRFELHDTKGDLVGFRLPGFVKGMNAPGWHLHYLDAARKNGGHVLNFSIADATMRHCECTDYRIILPESPETLADLDLDGDFSADLRKAEAER